MAKHNSSRRIANQSTSDESRNHNTANSQEPAKKTCCDMSGECLAPHQLSLPGHKEPLRFDGETIEPADVPRLTGQLELVVRLMKDGRARTIPEVARAVQCSETSASARLRDLRKPRFGSHTVNRERDENRPGVWRYSLILNSRCCNE